MPDDLNSLLNLALDGRLTPAQKARVEARLKRAPAARRLAALRAVREAVGSAAPVVGEERSRRMWSGIASRLDPAPARQGVWQDPEPSAWKAFWTRRWLGAWGMGLAGAAAALALVFTVVPRPGSHAVPGEPPATRPSSASAPVPAAVPSSAQALAASFVKATPALNPGGNAAALRASEGRPREATAMASLPSAATDHAPARAAQSPSGPTEVEQALAANQVDELIDQFLVARQSGSAPAPAPALAMAQGPSGSGEGASLGEEARTGGASTVGFQQGVSPVEVPEAADGKAPRLAQGWMDSAGFWNWKPAAIALNDHAWSQAKVELEAASQHAGAAAERAFANSALSVLSVPGQPLEGVEPVLPDTGDLRVLAAGAWQLQVESRQARFSGGVSVRLPGLRADGDSLLMDLTFDRADFAPGTRFTRVSGESPAIVVDSAMQPVSGGEFYAPAGAVYNIPDQVLRLK